MAPRPGLFEDIDSLEPDRFAAHLADDVVFVFGNADAVHGRAAVRDVWAGFCATVAGVRHDPLASWQDGATTVAEARVTYTKTDGSTVTVPACTVYRGDDLIEEYRVYIDLAPLFAA